MTWKFEGDFAFQVRDISFRYFNTSGDITRFRHLKSAVFVIRKSRDVKKHHDVVIVVRDAVQQYSGALQIGCSTTSRINNATADQQTAAPRCVTGTVTGGDAATLGRTSARGSQQRRYRSVPELPVPRWPWPLHTPVRYQRRWTAWPEYKLISVSGVQGRELHAELSDRRSLSHRGYYH